MNDKINQFMEQQKKDCWEKEIIEYSLKHLGVNVEKIKEAGKLDPQKYVTHRRVGRTC